jgi:pumilio family protein 6
MKGWKTHVARIAKEEHGHLALLALLDAIDDTKALDKV